MIVRALTLALRLAAAMPEVDLRGALENAAVAIEVATPALSPELLLAVAFVESRFDTTAVSRPHGDQPPYYCSILQTAALSEAECVAQRDPHVAYHAGVLELGQWARRCRGDPTCLLNGHGCGNLGVITGRCNGYAARVLAFAERLR